MVSPTKTALAKGILDAAVLELRGTQEGLLAEDSLQMLERRCVTLCTEHLSLDRSAIRIIRAGVSPSKKHSLHKGKHRYAVAFSITSDNQLLRFTLYRGATGDGFDALEPRFEKMTGDRIAFSVFFQISTATEFKQEPAPQIVIGGSNKESPLCHSYHMRP